MMKKIICIWLLLSLSLFLLAGCSRKDPGTEEGTGADGTRQKVTLYYTDEDGYSLIDKSYDPSFDNESSIKHKVDVLMQYLADPSLLGDEAAGLRSIIPERLISHVIMEVEYPQQDGAVSNVIRIEMTDSYYGLSTSDRLMFRTGVSQSLFSIPEISRVDLVILQDEQIQRIDQIYAEDRMIINQYDEGFYRDELKVTLYFSNAEGTGLVPEERLIRLGMTESLWMGIVRSLIEGPQDPSLVKTIPEGTKINDIVVEDRICYLDLNDMFQMNHAGGEMAEKLTVYSLVNSLGKIGGIDQVQILIDGQKVPLYKSYVPIDRFLEPDLSLVISQ